MNIYNKVLSEYRKTGDNCRCVMLIGDNNQLANHISAWIAEHPEMGLKLGGVLSNMDLEEKSPRTLEVMFDQKGIDHIIVASPRKTEHLMPKIASIADNMGIGVKIMLPNAQTVANRADFDTLAGIPVINSRNGSLDSLHNHIAKRILDVTVSLPVVALHLLLMPWIGAIIRLTSRGPAIFRQKRIGKDGREFIMYKFRTMNSNNHRSKEEALAGIGDITEGGDKRITPIGQWLRKTGVDELPQFFNVLIGDMSIVGPRPYMVSEDIELEGKLDRYTLRRRVKPGITGWAQVNGYRGGTRDMTLMQKRTDHDIWYAENWSLGLDMKIIAATFYQAVRAAIDSH